VADLRSLIYVSEATRPLSEADLGAMLYASRAHNATVGVTGLLIFERSVGPKGRFVQCLEGEGDSVARVFARRIVGASQHTTIEVVWEGPIERRDFADWSMKYARSIDAAPAETTDLLRRTGRLWP